MLNMRILSSFNTSPIDLRGLPETLLPHKDFQTDIEEIKKSKGPESDPQDR